MSKKPQAFFYYNAGSFYANARYAWTKDPRNKRDFSVREINPDKLSRKICRDQGWELGDVIYQGAYMDGLKETPGGCPVPSTTNMQLGVSIIERITDDRLAKKNDIIIVIGSSGADFDVVRERIDKFRKEGRKVQSCALKIGSYYVHGCHLTVDVPEDMYKACQLAKAEKHGSHEPYSSSAARKQAYGRSGTAGDWARPEDFAHKTRGPLKKMQAEIFEESAEQKAQVLDAFGRAKKDDDLIED